MKRERAFWDTLLHFRPDCYPTYKSYEDQPADGKVVKAQVIGAEHDDQVIRVGDTLFLWRYKTTDIEFCKVHHEYIWRGCGGFDF